MTWTYGGDDDEAFTYGGDDEVAAGGGGAFTGMVGTALSMLGRLELGTVPFLGGESTAPTWSYGGDDDSTFTYGG